MTYSKQELEAFRIIAKKMPVADCDKCIIEVKNSWSVVSRYLSAIERERLWLAASYSIYGQQGRGQFDDQIRTIYKRLGVDYTC